MEVPMQLANPFWLLHHVSLTAAEQFCWWLTSRYADWDPPRIAMWCMFVGITVIIFGATMVHPVLFWFLGALLGLPFIAATGIRAAYRHNTRTGTVNRMQLEWPYMVACHLFALVFLVLCLGIDDPQAPPARIMALGMYLLVVPTYYILATNTLPPNYQMRRYAVATP